MSRSDRRRSGRSSSDRSGDRCSDRSGCDSDLRGGLDHESDRRRDSGAGVAAQARHAWHQTVYRRFVAYIAKNYGDSIATHPICTDMAWWELWSCGWDPDHPVIREWWTRRLNNEDRISAYNYFHRLGHARSIRRLTQLVVASRCGIDISAQSEMV